uniref:Uncharacterized protein n=1 Tax=Panagrolaimus superbus TaxID=310955 RepID=A0A914YLF6_9BILA
MSRQLRPRKPVPEKEEDFYDEVALKERKAERNKAAYARNKKKIAAKNKVERGEAYDEYQKKYYRENKQKFADRKAQTEYEIREEQRAELNRKVADLKILYPYDQWRAHYSYSHKHWICLPKNKFFCQRERQFYQLHQDEQMNVYEFFNEIVLHDKHSDSCLPRDHHGWGDKDVDKEVKRLKRIADEEFQQKHNYVEYQTSEILEMGGKYRELQTSDWFFGTVQYLPRDENRFYCKRKSCYYKYTGDEEMNIDKFFKEVALEKHRCRKEYHCEKFVNHVIFDGEEVHPYEMYNSYYDVSEMGGRFVEGGRYVRDTWLPRDINRFWCEKARKYYKYMGNEQMDIAKFFKEVVKHDCDEKYHSDRKEGHFIFDPAEEPAATEESKPNE